MKPFLVTCGAGMTGKNRGGGADNGLLRGRGELWGNGANILQGSCSAVSPGFRVYSSKECGFRAPFNVNLNARRVLLYQQLISLKLAIQI